jgi:hypothetical protein
MQIITEKIQSQPNHSITKKDIKAIIEIIPDDWIGATHVFSISSQLFENSNWDRPVIKNKTNFKILSRGIERNEIIKELLIELAIRPTKINPPRRHILTKTQRKKLEETIDPYYKKLIK